jgi:hypothetical protein
MKINVKLDEFNRVSSYAIFGSIEGGVDVEVDDSFDPKKDYAYVYVDGHLVFSPEVEAEFVSRTNMELLRERRESECFTVINRGGLWYDMLTLREKNDLLEWYHAWLDAPSTGVIPDRPSWLD